MTIIKRTFTLLAALAALLAFAVGPAQAGVKYTGKTKGGHKISFTKSGSRISKIVTGLPTVCTSPSSFYGSRSGVEIFNAPGAFRLGGERKRTAQVRSAMWYGEITKHFRVDAKARGKKVTGKLSVAFAYGQPTMDYYGAHLISWYCQGTTKFTASPK